MELTGELLIVLTIVALAGGYLFRRWTKARSKDGHCSSACGCAKPKKPSGRT